MNGYGNHEDFGTAEDYMVPVRRKGKMPKRIAVTPITMVQVTIGGSEHLLTMAETEVLQDALRSMYEPVSRRG